MMIQFDLDCPDCGFTNIVVTTEELPVVDWTCGVCEAQPITSLPTDEFGELI